MIRLVEETLPLSECDLFNKKAAELGVCKVEAIRSEGANIFLPLVSIVLNDLYFQKGEVGETASLIAALLILPFDDLARLLMMQTMRRTRTIRRAELPAIKAIFLLKEIFEGSKKPGVAWMGGGDGIGACWTLSEVVVYLG